MLNRVSACLWPAVVWLGSVRAVVGVVAALPDHKEQQRAVHRDHNLWVGEECWQHLFPEHERPGRTWARWEIEAGEQDGWISIRNEEGPLFTGRRSAEGGVAKYT